MTGSAMASRRLLVISYHFGMEGATGGFRWAAMSRELCARGWQVDVITASTEPVTFEGLTRHVVPPVHWPIQALQTVLAPLVLGKRLLRTLRPRATLASGRRPSSPAATGGRMSVAPVRPPAGQARVQLAEMLAQIRWAGGAERVGRALVRSHRYRAVIVSSPPHEHHAAGRRLAQVAGVPVIADYRDPWVLGTMTDFQEFSRPYTRLAERLDRSAQHESDVIIHNTSHAMRAYERACPTSPARRVSIPNGYDPVESTSSTKPCSESDAFTILFSGHLYWFMDISVLLASVQRLVEDPSVDGRQIRLQLVGTAPTHAGRPWASWFAEYGLSDHATVLPRCPRSEARALQQLAAVLVVFDYPFPLAIPMKFYDYLQAPGELLILTQPDSALAQAAAACGKTTLLPSDVTSCGDALLAWYRRRVDRTPSAAHDPSGIHARPARVSSFESLMKGLESSRFPE